MEDLKKEMHCPITVSELKEGDEVLKGTSQGLVAILILREPKLSKTRKSWLDRTTPLYVNTLCKCAIESKQRNYKNYNGTHVTYPYKVYSADFSKLNVEKRLNLNEQSLWLVRRKIENL